MSQNTEAGAIAALANIGKVQSDADIPVPFVFLPQGHSIESLEKLRERPTRIKNAVKVVSIDSFIAYLLDRKTEHTVVFADEKTRTMLGVIDYHEKTGVPSWCTHVVEYTADLSREWMAWSAFHGTSLSQANFADFLEERVLDIVKPSGAQMLEIATKLSIIQKVVFGSAMRLSSGEFQLTYNSDNQKGTIEVPEKIELGIPVLHKGAAYKVEARLRHRLHEGAVHFSYKIVEPEHVVETAFAKQVAEIVNAGFRVYEGMPKAAGR